MSEDRCETGHGRRKRKCKKKKKSQMISGLHRHDKRVHHKDLKMNVSFTAGRQQICFVDYVEGGEDD